VKSPQPPCKRVKRSLSELSPGQRRRRIYRTLGQPLLGAVLLFILYFTLPLDHPISTSTVIVMAIGLMLVAAWVALQVVHILRSDFPVLRAIGALATSIPLFLLLFAAGYYLIEHNQTNAFNETMNRVDALYYTVTVFSTVGFGDIAPKTQPARIVTMIQMMGQLVLLGITGKVIIGAVQVSRERSNGETVAEVLAETPEPTEDPTGS
jgi:voltage-gated potassium channel